MSLHRKPVNKNRSSNTFKKDITTVKLVNIMPSTTSRGGLRF
jgi:hypothetical protein